MISKVLQDFCRTFISLGNFKKRNHIEIKQNIHLSIFQKSLLLNKVILL
jgi:hypothetical protein